MSNRRYHGHGFVLGKFMPLHKGHMHLLRTAEAACEQLTILVCSLPQEPISGTLRYQWVRRLFPKAQVLHLDDPMMPQEPADHPFFWDIWRKSIRRLVPEPIDAVFASEDYGWQLAAELGAMFVPVDPARAMVPISGTEVRRDPYGQWRYLPAPVRGYYAKRVAILGAESAGKSTLTTQLAQHFSTVGVEEYARQFLMSHVRMGSRQDGEFRFEDLEHIARGQAAIEDSLAEQCNQVLICDTDVLTTLTWSQHYFGRTASWLGDEASRRRYDLTLVLHPDGVSFVDDGQRIMDRLSVRMAFFDRLIGNLRQVNRPYVVIGGGHNERFARAVKEMSTLLNHQRRVRAAY